MSDKRLAPNFRASEFLHEGAELIFSPDGRYAIRSEGLVDEEAARNLFITARVACVLRDFYGKPIHITSGYRAPAWNKAVGGAPNSLHLRGLAFDCVVEGVDRQEVWRYWRDRWSGGLGTYPIRGHNHFDLGTRRRWIKR